MPIILPGDKEFEKRPSIERKALKINLNDRIYGTFAEIGAGQEVARHFFRAGGATFICLCFALCCSMGRLFCKWD